MKIIAHRGWSIGDEENSITAFKKAIDKKVDGVEFDIRRSLCGKEIIISHEPCELEKALLLEDGLRVLSETNLELLIELKECDNEFLSQTIALLEKYSLKEKSLLFGFHGVAEKLDWSRNDIKLGIISEYPWDIKKDIEKFDPDFVLMGWDYRWWTKPVFKMIWSVFSLPKVCAKYPKVSFVVGIAGSERDYNWLCKQNGLYCCTADSPLEW